MHITALEIEINGYDLLLRNDALRQLKTIKIDYAEGKAAFELGNIDVEDQAPENKNSIFFKESCQIPAHCVTKARIGCELEAGKSRTLKMVEPSPKVTNDKGLSVKQFCYPSDSLP